MLRSIFRENYLKYFILNTIVILIFRGAETIALIAHTGFQLKILTSELFGSACDLIFSNAILLLTYPLYFIIARKYPKTADILSLCTLISFSLLHLLILRYYIYQFIPLDISIFQHSLHEVFFTVKTSGIDFREVFLTLLSTTILIIFAFLKLKKIQFQEKFAQFSLITAFISIPCLLLLGFTELFFHNNISKNKSLFFYSKSIVYLFQSQKKTSKYSHDDTADFQSFYPGRHFSDPKFPLLHDFTEREEIQNYFHDFETMPNIVILIVEGLNDDYLHTYKGLKMMPFLDSIRMKSLYWNRCFTLGERSYAVVPSLLGGLPYGDKGFTLLQNIPRHLSLLSILKSNGYHTSFFYGQGKWFHQKDRFFEYNHTDIIFDNEMYDSEYEKIIVGDEKIFWGYNDKDLFSQSFKVIDTFPMRPQLHVYFTGTMHSPFIISQEEYYDRKLSDLSSTLKDKEQILHLKKHSKYLKTILFTDDALRDYFHTCSLRPEFENTIFIITGDHPMSEIPVANSLKRYHVPLMIYAPKLAKPAIFSQTVSHLDLYETLLSLLKPYLHQIPSRSTSLGRDLLTHNNEGYPIIFMNGNRDMMDCYFDGFYLAENKLYRVEENLAITLTDNPPVFKSIKDKLEIFKKTNQYVCFANKIISNEEYCKALKINPLYSHSTNDSESIPLQEYTTIVPPIEVPSHDLVYEIYFEYSGNMKDVLLIYELKTAKDSTLIWESFGVMGENNSFQGRSVVPIQSLNDSTFLFRSYIGNPKNQNINIQNLEILLYQTMSE